MQQKYKIVIRLLIVSWLILVAGIDIFFFQKQSTCIPGYITFQIDTSKASPNTGKAYTFDLGTFFDLSNSCSIAPTGYAINIAGDASVNNRASELILLENSKPTGPPHTSHNTIRELGEGRYSHWGTTLYFSASDSSDVRTNNRQYAVMLPIHLKQSLFIVLILFNGSCFGVLLFLHKKHRSLILKSIIAIGVLWIFSQVLQPGIITSLDTIIPPVLFMSALAGAILSWICRFTRGKGISEQFFRTERRLAVFTTRWGLAICFLAGILSVASVWSMHPGHYPPAHDYCYSFLGHIPNTDAGGYRSGGMHLLNEGTLDIWNQRRPLNAMLLAVRLWLSDYDLRIAILVQAFLLGSVLFMCSRTMGRIYGVWSGIGFFSLMYADAQFYGPNFMSESLGMTFAGLAFVLIISGFQNRSPYRVSGGLLALTLGLLARAGAMFILPAIWLAAFWQFRRPFSLLVKSMVLITVSIILGFAINTAVHKIYGTDENVTNSNFSYTVLGLARNVSWSEAEKGFEEDLAKLSSQKERVSFRYRKGLELIREDPKPFFLATTKALKSFISQLFPRIEGKVMPTYRFGRGGRPKETKAIVLFLLIVFLIALVKNRRSLTVMWLSLWFGIIASIPIIFTDGGWRVLTSVSPFLAAPSAIGLMILRPRRTNQETEPEGMYGYERMAAILLATLSILSVVGPAIAIQFSNKPDTSLWNIEQNELLIRTKSALSAVAVIDEKEILLGNLPRLTPGQFRDLVQYDTAQGQEVDLLLEESSPFIIMIADDCSTKKATYGGRNIFIMKPQHLLEFYAPFTILKSEPIHSGNRMYRVISARAAISEPIRTPVEKY